MRASSRPLTLAVGALIAVSMTAPAGGTPAAVSAPPVVVRPSMPDVVRSVNGTDAIQLPSATTAEAPVAGRAAKAQAPSGAAEVAVRAPSGGSARSALDTSTRAGSLPVWIDGVRTDGPSKVAVRWNSGQRPSVAVRRTDGGTARGPVRVTVDYSAFRDTYGADWAARLQLTPTDPGAPGSTISGVRNDVASGRLTADVPVGATDRTFALAAAPAGSTGDYKATSLSPSGKWQVSASTGAFAWSYGLRVPPVPGELAPDLSVAYSSNSVDGRTVSTNSQPSWLGEGWSLWPGYIERAYKGCADDLNGNNGTTKTGDLCWETENATLSFGDHSGQLVLAGGAGGTWRLKDDDGTKVERLTGAGNGDGGDPANSGEHWRVTTTDGTQYVFGRRADSAWTVPVFGNDSGEPCFHTAAYDASQCEQAYRWNLDYVVDVHGNSLTYTYREESNNYAVNVGRRTASYTRGGTLERIDYGTRDGQGGQPPARVLFDVGDRCLSNCGVHDATTWPDVPWDQDCAAAPCTGKWSPTFWSTKRLTRVSTQVSTGGGNYRTVDQWDFAHSFPVPGDNTTASLWLTSITMTGLAASPSIALPPVTFEGTMLQNRVNSAADGLPKLNKFRITAIKTESGGAIDISYAAPDCADGGTPPVADDNKTRCFPVRWTMPPATQPRDDWFHRYVVAKVVEDDLVGGNKDMVTSYDYQGGGAWAYDDNPLVDLVRRTWSQWRGYEKVVVRKGDPVNDLNKPESWTLHQTFRGMNGDKRADGSTRVAGIKDSTGASIPDDEQLAGFERETITRNGISGGQLGEEVGGEIHTPFSRLTGIQDQPNARPLRAFQLEDAGTATRARKADATFRTTRLSTMYDEYGNPTQVDDAGDTADATDNRCTTTTYAKNTAKLLVNLVKTVRSVGVACGTTPSLPADAVNDTQTYYDGGGLDAVPTKGDVTRTETAKVYTGGTPAYVATSTSDTDDFGRANWTDDALARRTSTAYTETNGLITSTKVTNPLTHQATTTVDPAWGLPLTVVDANGRTTSMKYDALGRLVKVWKPGRTEAHGDSPHLRYTYQVRNNAPSTVRTDTLKANGNQVASYTLLDGFLRERQTQAPSPQGGRILTDTLYDSRGLVNVMRAPYYHKDAPPGTALFVPNAGEVPNATVKVYDGAGRETDSIYTKLNVEQWRTRTYPAGDQTSVVPPAGGTASTTVSDARGQITKLLQYKQRPATGAPTGAADTTQYGYTKSGQLASVTDTAGNVWRYDYDIRGNRIRTDDPDHGVSTMSYDDGDQPVTTTDARGNKLVARYDNLGRKTETRLDTGSGTSTLLTSAVYDTLAKGELTSSTSYAGTTAYTTAVTGYDASGRPSGETTTIPAAEGDLAGTYTTSVSYAADGSTGSLGLPALGTGTGQVPGETLIYGYDDLGLPDTLTGITSYVTDTKYTALGEQTQLELGVTGKKLWQTTYREEGTRRVNEVLTERDQASGVMVDDLRYGYDQSDNVTKITDRTAGSTADTQCFDYDYLRRVSSAWTATDDCAAAPAAALIGGPAPYWHQFGYDTIGNRKTLTRKGLGGAADTVSTYRYPTAGDGTDRPHAVSSIESGQTTAGYSYDAAGNTLSRPGPGGTQTLAWDERSRLSSISSAQGTTGYVYDADGRQLIRRDPNTVTLYVSGGEVVLDRTSRTKTGLRYYDDHATRTPAALTWLVSDQHGTSQVAVDAGSLAATARRLDLFGNPRAGSGLAAVWAGGNRGFVGGTLNPASGLTRLGAREYDPALGKFISADPISDPADPQQLNAYAYASNNPATLSDAGGLHVFEGDSGGWTDSGVYHNPAPAPPPAGNPGCDGRTRCAYPSSGDNLPPGNSKLWQPVDVKGRKINKETVKNFREFGYRGSDNVTYADLLQFAAQGDDQFVLACTAVAGLSQPLANSLGSCTQGMAIQGDPTVWIARAAKILYELTPIADIQHCMDGSDSCWWILANIPGGKFAKIPHIVDKATDAARTFGRFGADDLRAAAQASDRNGLTQVGRALQKHSDRDGSAFLGLSSGSADARNDQALRVLDEILNDTGGRTEVLDRVTNIWDSSGRGVRFSNDGSFMGFLEPGR